MDRRGRTQNRAKRIIACILVLALSAFFAGQMYLSAYNVQAATDSSKKQPTDPVDAREQYAAVLYNTDNGLLTSEANAIAETEDGFLWIGSYSGVTRYDGNTFERLDSTEGIANSRCLFVDSNQDLWIGTNDCGVAVLGKGKTKIFNKSDGLPASSVRAICEDENGDIYVGTTGGMAVIDSDQNLVPLDDENVNGQFVLQLIKGADGLIYGLTMNGSIFTVKDRQIQDFYTQEDLGIEGVYSMTPDKNNPGYIYIGTGENRIYYGTFERELGKRKVYDTGDLYCINYMGQYGDKIWICADNGIGKLELGKVSILKDVPMSYSVEHMIQDYQGNLWFTSSGQGVMKVVPCQFQDIYEKYDLKNQWVNTTCRYDDMLFIGTDDGITVLNDDGQVDSVPIVGYTSPDAENKPDDLISLLSGYRVRSIVSDSRDRMWFSTYGENGIVMYDKGKVTRFTVDDGLPSDRVRVVCEMSDGSFIAACTGGVAVIEGDKITRVYGEECGITNTEILSVAEGENGEILVGTDGGGIFVIKDGKAENIGLDKGLVSEVVMRIIIFVVDR